MFNHVCPKCGRAFGIDNVQPVQKCPYCGHQFVGQQAPNYSNVRGPFDMGPSGKSRGVAGLLAILVGALGIHYFYVGKTTMGLIFLFCSIISCGILAALTSLCGIVQGIVMLTMTEEDFENHYVYSTDKITF